MDSTKRVLTRLFLLVVAAFALMPIGRAADHATTIVGTDLADGTGAALRRANVRFVNDRIVSVGDVKPMAGDTIVDGSGLVVAPGFIDIHNHSASGLAGNPAAETQLAQGITTVVVGPDGDSPWPIGDYLAERRQAASGVNVATFVGHATVRRQVMKDDFKRAARPDEIARMALLVDQGMREGAAGLSSGLEYEVGGYAATSELIELASVVARYGGVYMSHIRDEADKSFDALKEAIAIGEGAHVAVQISHIKLGTVGVWRKAAEAVALVEAARARGVDVTADAYPYNAWQSTITVLVPNKRYDDPPSVERALADVGGAKNVLVVRHAAHPDYEFKALDAIAAEQKRTPVEQFIQIVKDGGATVVCTSMVDEDIRAFYRQPWVMVGSDGGLANRHPRGAGTFPRVLGRYVRDQQWLTLPEAIRKMTSAPAARLRLEGRGRIAAGAIADVVLFNPKTIIDRSTFTEPGVLSAGVEKVFVAGDLVWDRGKATAARPGRVLMSGHAPVETDTGLYRLVPGWGQLTAPLSWGETPSISLDATGRVFAFTRAEPPVIELDPSGNVLKAWGEKMFVWPHGLRIDRNGFLWITDGRARNGIGQQVFKFTRDGQLVMTLGKKGVSGDGPDTFNSPTDVAVAPNGDIFVSDGHVNSRIVKFAKDGTFIKAWGKRGDGPGEFNVPHTIFFDSRGRLLVGDRSNRRIQIFDQDGTFLDQWTQFGSPSGIFIAPDDTLYVVDYNDKMALFVGSAKDGSIRYRSEQVLAEGVVVDPSGAIYVGETVTGHLGDTVTGHTVKKLVKKVEPATAAWNAAALDDLAAYVQSQKTTGFLIIQDRRVILERNWPLPASAATFAANFTHGTDARGALQEDVASAQKSFIAILAGIAIDKGLLDISRPVSAYIGPGWSKAAPAQETAITVRHLLTMNSGLTEPLTYEAPAGTAFFYNTPAYAILKPVLEKASGRTLDELTRVWLTDPAGMRDTLWRPRPAAFADVGNPTGLYTTPGDMAKLGQLVLDTGKAADGTRVISEAQLAATFERSPTNPAYGRLWWINGSSYSILAGRARLETPLIPAAPTDLVAALGAQDRKIYVARSRKLVVVRTGQAAPDRDFNQQVWLRLMKAAPKG